MQFLAHAESFGVVPNPAAGVLAAYPLEARQVFAAQACELIGGLRAGAESAPAALASPQHVFFAMECLGCAFSLPILPASTTAIIAQAVKIYHGWLVGGAARPACILGGASSAAATPAGSRTSGAGGSALASEQPPPPPTVTTTTTAAVVSPRAKDNDRLQQFYRDIFRQCSALFSPDLSSLATVEHHAKLCLSVLAMAKVVCEGEWFLLILFFLFIYHFAFIMRFSACL